MSRLDRHYALSLCFSWEKIVVITAVALVFSLFSTSTASAITFTFFFWIMGHFSTEILFLARKASQPFLIVRLPGCSITFSPTSRS